MPIAGLPCSNTGAAGKLAQPRSQVRVADAHAEIRLQRSEAEIEQDGAAIFRAQRIAIGAKFGQRAAAVHRAIIGRQAKRDPLIPAGFGDAFRGERPDALMG